MFDFIFQCIGVTVQGVLGSIFILIFAVLIAIGIFFFNMGISYFQEWLEGDDNNEPNN